MLLFQGGPVNLNTNTAPELALGCPPCLIHSTFLHESHICAETLSQTQALFYPQQTSYLPAVTYTRYHICTVPPSQTPALLFHNMSGFAWLQ